MTMKNPAALATASPVALNSTTSSIWSAGGCALISEDVDGIKA